MSQLSLHTRAKRALSRSEYLKIASVADVDPRSVKTYFEGSREPMPATKRVIRMALAELGVTDPHPGA